MPKARRMRCKNKWRSIAKGVGDGADPTGIRLEILCFCENTGLPYRYAGAFISRPNFRMTHFFRMLLAFSDRALDTKNGRRVTRLPLLIYLLIFSRSVL